VPWLDVNLPARWLLNSRRVLVPWGRRASKKSAGGVPCSPCTCGVTQTSPSPPPIGTHSRPRNGVPSGAPATSVMLTGIRSGLWRHPRTMTMTMTMRRMTRMTMKWRMMRTKTREASASRLSSLLHRLICHWRGLRLDLQWSGGPRRHQGHGRARRLPVPPRSPAWPTLRRPTRAHRGGGACRGRPRQH
jgi:hypothetical protein